jgi:DNA invertase Pin-like site-specific DNA recombinase
MIYGYARVSTEKQDLQVQLRALREAKCDVIRREKRGATKARPQFERLLKGLKAGDVLVVLRIDRAFRSMIHAMNVLEDLRRREVFFVCLTQTVVDTRQPSDAATKFVLHVLAAAAQMERETLIERVKEGMEEARRKGKRIGRHWKLADDAKREQAILMRKSGKSLREIGRALSISKTTVGLWFQTHPIQEQPSEELKEAA